MIIPTKTSSMSITWRWTAVFARNFLVWRKQFWTALFGNAIEPLFVLVGIGYGLGALVGSVQYQGKDVPYLLFLASGAICMSTANAATFEALYSAYARKVPQRTWEGITFSPVTLTEVVFAEIVWAGFKSVFAASVIMAVIFLLGISREPTMWLALPILFLMGTVFAAMAMVVTWFAKSWEAFVFYVSLVITPMSFLSGVYFPREQLPGFLQTISNWMPLTWGVAVVRPLLLP
jgi:lipooligosaccharide transport system permease protein